MRIAVVGLGYVGLPLAVELGRFYPTTGYDPKPGLIEHYRNKYDPTNEVNQDQFESASNLTFTNVALDLTGHDIYIVAVPTPVDNTKQPDLTSLKSASRMLGKVIEKDSLIIYESTVFPGATEEVCVPLLEQYSGLVWKRDFNVGYSPERMNPSDKVHTLKNIVKIVSADTENALVRVAEIYQKIITAGIYKAPSIKVAEAAKVIENTQRDLNIAFVNELAMIFDKMDIDTKSVLDAAQTKWNFLRFNPGLVGGHCIGVDPYYLTSKAQSVGYQPEVILAGRRINDGMGHYIAEKTVKKMFANDISGTAKVLVCGLTFKENCADLRNSHVKRVIEELQDYHLQVMVYDPVADKLQAKEYYNIELCDWSDIPRVNAIILAVPHKQLIINGIESFKDKLLPNSVFIDVKSVFDQDIFSGTKIDYWRL